MNIILTRHNDGRGTLSADDPQILLSRTSLRTVLVALVRLSRSR